MHGRTPLTHLAVPPALCLQAGGDEGVHWRGEEPGLTHVGGCLQERGRGREVTGGGAEHPSLPPTHIHSIIPLS
jgi:hypothetical protein